MGSVLVVDDEFGIVDLIEAVLTDEGHRVLTAANGLRGFELLASEHVDVMFLDYMMPVMDGATLLRRIKEDPQLKDIPVVMMSSMTQATIEERCQGYAVFLRKPFRIAEVINLTAKLIATPSPPADPVGK